MYLTIEELSHKINNLTTNMSKLQMAETALLRAMYHTELCRNGGIYNQIGGYPTLWTCRPDDINKCEEEYRSPLVPDLNVWDLVTLVNLCKNYYLYTDLSLTYIPLEDLKKLLSICPFAKCYDSLSSPRYLSMGDRYHTITTPPTPNIHVYAFPNKSFLSFDGPFGTIPSDTAVRFPNLGSIDVHIYNTHLRGVRHEVPFELIQANYLYLFNETFDNTGTVRKQITYNLKYFKDAYMYKSDSLSSLDKRRMGEPLMSYRGKAYVDTRINTRSKTIKWRKRILEAMHKYLIRGEFSDN